MRPVSEREFVSCDWGTSHFRLKWVSNGKVIAEYQDGHGCKPLFDSGEGTSRSRASRFESQLQGSLGQLFRAGYPAEPLALLVSGMASSSIGWKELPYASLPIPLDGSQIKADFLSWNQPPYVGRTVLVSGVATETNMMRGEETEAIGLFSSIPNPPVSFVLVLPGTHSKHLQIDDGILRDIRTYMTGELYAVLSQHSVLAASVSNAAEFDAEGFFAGVEAAQEPGIAASLFHTRARQVVGGKRANENAAFLSGLLIGAELKDLAGLNHQPVLLGGTPKLRDLYSRALSHLRHENWRAFPDDDCKNAVARGHQIILSQLSLQ